MKVKILARIGEVRKLINFGPLKFEKIVVFKSYGFQCQRNLVKNFFVVKANIRVISSVLEMSE